MNVKARQAILSREKRPKMLHGAIPIWTNKFHDFWFNFLGRKLANIMLIFREKKPGLYLVKTSSDYNLRTRKPNLHMTPGV